MGNCAFVAKQLLQIRDCLQSIFESKWTADSNKLSFRLISYIILYIICYRKTLLYFSL